MKKKTYTTGKQKMTKKEYINEEKQNMEIKSI